MKAKLVVAIGVVVCLCCSWGCASVLKGTSQTVSFNSKPEGAQVAVDGKVMGVTPLSLKLKKNAYDNVTVTKEGYASITTPLEKKFDGIALIDIFWDFSTTDLITGAVYEYEPNQYFFEMKPAGAN